MLLLVGVDAGVRNADSDSNMSPIAMVMLLLTSNS